MSKRRKKERAAPVEAESAVMVGVYKGHAGVRWAEFRTYGTGYGPPTIVNQLNRYADKTLRELVSEHAKGMRKAT